MKPVSSSVAPPVPSKPIPPGIAKKEQQLPPGQLKRLDDLPKGIEARFPRPQPPVAEPPPSEPTDTTADAVGGTLDVTV